MLGSWYYAAFLVVEIPGSGSCKRKHMKMSSLSSNCPHLESAGEITKEELIQKSHGTCQDCKVRGPNLWECLENRCPYVGCGESHLVSLLCNQLLCCTQPDNPLFHLQQHCLLSRRQAGRQQEAVPRGSLYTVHRAGWWKVPGCPLKMATRHS